MGPTGATGLTGATGPTGQSPVLISGLINGSSCTQNTSSGTYSVTLVNLGSTGPYYCLITITPAVIPAVPVVSATAFGSISTPEFVQTVYEAYVPSSNEEQVGLAVYGYSGGGVVDETGSTGANEINFEISAPSG